MRRPRDRCAYLIAVLSACGCGARTDLASVDTPDAGVRDDASPSETSSNVDAAPPPSSCNDVSLDDAPEVLVTEMDSHLTLPSGGGTLGEGRWVLVDVRRYRGHPSTSPPFLRIREALLIHGNVLERVTLEDDGPLVRATETWTVEHFVGGSGYLSRETTCSTAPRESFWAGFYAATPSTLTVLIRDSDVLANEEWTYVHR